MKSRKKNHNAAKAYALRSRAFRQNRAHNHDTNNIHGVNTPSMTIKMITVTAVITIMTVRIISIVVLLLLYSCDCYCIVTIVLYQYSTNLYIYAQE